MPHNVIVRASRDGDQFHYLWAARRCLRLLAPRTGLRAVTIEGISANETLTPEPVAQPDEEVVDVAEYYGSEDLANASAVRYIQLKHSTLQPAKPWTISGLRTTLSGFATRFRAVRQKTADGPVQVTFEFVTNRPIDASVLTAFSDVAAGSRTHYPAVLNLIRKYTGLRGAELRAFCGSLRLKDRQAGYWDQRNLLFHDLRAYLPDSDADAPVQLKELITRKAGSEGSQNPAITKVDVLRALKADELSLFPAPCLIESLKHAIPRQQEPELLKRILLAGVHPVIIHAAGGVGKSVFARNICGGLPTSSVTVLYDCFGNGGYRNPTGYRHHHKTAFVQIANELASLGLCDPLVPSPWADVAAYTRAFLHRLEQSVTTMRSESRDGLVVLIVDAADNAQMAAEEINEPRSFIRDLLRETLPDGVRLVVLCRTHRQALLDPPLHAVKCQLQPFTTSETAANLRRKFPGATDQDAAEFCAITAGNPRVQTAAMAHSETLGQVFRIRGPLPTDSDAAVQRLLDDAFASVRDKAGPSEKGQLDTICTAMAVLRPFIPIAVLTAISRVDEAAIRSFVADLGQPILLTESAVQFLDEPTETWFRDKFKPSESALIDFVQVLKPLSSTSPYVAAALPQVMLAAGHLSELVEMALTSAGLPTKDPIQSRDIELHRLQFALRASLRMGAFADAVKLSLKAGGESAGNERQQDLLQKNTDLAGIFLQPDEIRKLVSARFFQADWAGSHHAYESAMMSGRAELLGEARSRLRMALEWLHNWHRLSRKERQREQVNVTDVVELATAHINLHGPAACAQFLTSWQPAYFRFQVTSELAARLVDHGRYGAVCDLAEAAPTDMSIVLAAIAELRRVYRNPNKRAIMGALRIASRRKLDTRLDVVDGHEYDTLSALSALVEAGVETESLTRRSLARTLARALPKEPPRSLTPRFGNTYPILRAYALNSVLLGHDLLLRDVAHPELRAEMDDHRRSESQELRRFRAEIGALIPWHCVRARVILGVSGSSEIEAAVRDARSASEKAMRASYQEQPEVRNEIAKIWFEILVGATEVPEAAIEEYNSWTASKEGRLYPTTLIQLSRMAARSERLKRYSLRYASEAFGIVQNARDAADSKSRSYIELSRAVLPLGGRDAQSYFNEAVKVASKVGDENRDRWQAILDLADRAYQPGSRSPELAYKLSRCAEVVYEYELDDDHFDWSGTVHAIAGLDPSSSFAILSRWRDRQFGSAGGLLPELVTVLCGRGELSPSIGLALICFRGHWDFVACLKGVFSERKQKHERDVAAGICLDYMRWRSESPRSWAAMNDLLLSEGIAMGDRYPPQETEFPQTVPRDEAPRADAQPAAMAKEGSSWDAVFANTNLTSSSDIARAFQRLRRGEHPWRYEEFIDEMYRRVELGTEPDFISALANVNDLGISDLGRILRRVPDDWTRRISVRSAFGDAVIVVCTRCHMEVASSRRPSIFPYDVVQSVTGLGPEKIADVVISTIASGGDSLSAERLFTLVGLLISKLSHLEARDSLSFGLALFEDDLDANDGDGPWRPDLDATAHMDYAIAGYVWAGLASPSSTLRWEAAHVTRALCALGLELVLRELVQLATAGHGGPFADRKLHFYTWHGRQWLLIALSRAVLDHPKTVAEHASFLLDHAFGGPPHVLIREFASRAILCLIQGGFTTGGTGLKRRLHSVNISPFPPRSERGEFVHLQSPVQDESLTEFHFGIDADTYWFSPLARCFGVFPDGVKQLALAAVRADLGYAGDSREDARHDRRLFKDGETWNPRSDPAVHDLQFYLSYHATMISAGTLLATTAVHKHDDDSRDEFARWLEGNLLTRSDGRWLADRRDVAPTDLTASHFKGEPAEWRWSINRSDFERRLFAADEHLNVWGDWNSVSRSFEETVTIRSALVNKGRAPSLLRALQTCPPFRCAFPFARDGSAAYDSDGVIDCGEFQFKPWIVDSSSRSGLDERDPWAGEIGYPPSVPMDDVVRAMHLQTDADSRHWTARVMAGAPRAMTSRVWGEFRERHRDVSPNAGECLQASLAFLQRYLCAVKMYMLIKVEIRRTCSYTSYERADEEKLGYIQPSARLFVLQDDGQVISL